MYKRLFSLMIALLIGINTAYAQELQWMPDPILQKAVRQQLGMDADSPLTKADMLRLASLNTLELQITEKISDLTGLEYAVNLESLAVVGNHVQDIYPLANLTKLTFLDLGDNAISDVSPLVGLIHLEVLRLRNNQISDVTPLTGLVNLKDLWLNNNQISDFSPLAGLVNLEKLITNGNLAGDSSAQEVESVTTPHSYIYWTDPGGNKIQRANLDGSNKQTLATGVGALGIALDVADNKMYWTTGLPGKIQRANLDGSNRQTLITGNLSWPFDLALDVAGGKMYWTASTLRRIERANLDGSNRQTLIANGLPGPAGFALDVARGKMYWVDSSADKIERANLDGSNRQTLIANGLDEPRGIALDIAAGKMYWTDWGTDKIERANLDGSNRQTLIRTEAGQPYGIALDVAGGKMYWADTGRGKIEQSNLDGSNRQDFITGLRKPYHFALSITSESPPIIREADVDGDGVVTLKDLDAINASIGKTGENAADLNGDGIVSIVDLVLAAGALDTGAGAPATRAQILAAFTAEEVQQWLTEARLLDDNSPAYQRGIAVLAQLLEILLTLKETALLPNYPNPFNPETWLPYQLAAPADVMLTIYDINGRVVRTLDMGHQRAGMYHNRSRAAYWDGRNAHGETVASGVYFYTLTAGDFTATRKLLIRK